MRFTRIRLENWRNFGSVDIPLSSRAFIVGPNASGKSNFLDVFRLLRDIAVPGGGFRDAVARRGGVSRIRNLAARRYPNIAVDAEIETNGDNWRYRLAFSQDNQRNPTVSEENVWCNSKLVLSRPSDDDFKDEARLRQTYLEQTIANVNFRPVSYFLSTVRYYHIIPQLVRDPERYVGRKADPFGGDFLEQLATTNKRTLDARLRRIQRAMRISVPQLTELKLEKDERGYPHLLGRYEHWRPKGAWQTEADFSDGTLHLVGLLWALLDGAGPVLLEEPELSLHPEIIRHIPQLMRRVQRGRGTARRQILLSTHSPTLLYDRGIAPDEVLLVRPSAAGSEIEVGASNYEILRLMKSGLSAAEVAIPYTSPKDADQLTLFDA